MLWILVVLVLIAAVVAGLAVLRRWSPTASDGPRARAKCLRCRGTGWLDTGPERTLNFTGDGFEDRHQQATPCPDCDGTGWR
jgi:hypothetical protein